MKHWIPALAFVATAGTAMADTSMTIPMNMVGENGIDAEVGNVVVTETKYGTVFMPSLTGLPPGLHGFHVHENASCATKEKDGKKVPALAAGGHYDPKKPDSTAAHGVKAIWVICRHCTWTCRARPLNPCWRPV